MPNRKAARPLMHDVHATVPGTQRPAWMASIHDIYARMRMAAAQGPYPVSFEGLDLLVLPEVYAPNLFTDTVWFARRLAPIVRNSSLLEIGSGTGAIAIKCALAGAKVLATDINPAAVKNTLLNVRAIKADVDVRESDLYANVRVSEQFDFIFWAHPFNNVPYSVTDPLMLSGMDHEYRALESYVARASKHLTRDGRLLLGTGDSADLSTLDAICRRYNRERVILVRELLPLEYGGDAKIEYQLCELAPLNAATSVEH